MDKARGRAVFENNSKALWGCLHRTVSLNTSGVAYSACLSGRSYMAAGQRSVHTPPMFTRGEYCQFFTSKFAHISIIDNYVHSILLVFFRVCHVTGMTYTNSGNQDE